MSNFSALKTAIQAAIKQNGNNEITGDILQDILLSIVSTLGDSAINTLEQGLQTESQTRGNDDAALSQAIEDEATARVNQDTQLGNLITGIKNNIDNGYVYAGIATPSTSPVSGKVFYIATQAGTYTNLGNTAVKPGMSILKYNGSAWSNEQVIYTDGGVFDVSAYNGGATYASLEALLSDANLLTIIPPAVRKGGMSIKFVSSVDNKYVQYRLLSDTFKVAEYNWQSENADTLPTENSDNLVTSKGTYRLILPIVGIGETATAVGAQEGDYFYSTTFNEIRQKQGGSTVSISTPDNALFVLDDRFYKIEGQDIIQLTRDDIYNVTTQIPLSSGYYTLSTAIVAIPSKKRQGGMLITFRVDSDNWEIWQYKYRAAASQFENVGSWICISSTYYSIKNSAFININFLNNNPTGNYTLSTAIATIPSILRYGGMTICYKIADYKYAYSTYARGSTGDTYFLDINNWSNPIVYDGLDSYIPSKLFYIEKAINKYNGNEEERPSSSYYCTTYLPVTEGLQIFSLEGGTASRCSFYDKNLSFISSIIEGPTSGVLNLTVLTNENIPSGAKYFRATGTLDSYVKGFDLTTILNVYGSTKIINRQTSILPAKWIALGDSISEGWYSYMDGNTPSSTVDETKGWAYKTSKICGFDYINRSIGGTGYKCKGPNNLRNAKELVGDIDFSNYELVTLAYGCNDYKGSETLGTVTDNPSNGNTVLANMKYVIEKILLDNPLCKIFVIMPLNMMGYSFNFGDESTNYALGYQLNGKTLQDFYEGFVSVCNYYGIEYIDMTHYSSVNRKNIQQVLLDGVHPSEDEHTVLARELSKKILFY